ncbi:MAG TPA: hypothetical protein VK864_18845, partial [Longimicrobiales bacterium]|nr:hypothetical protein [Longimicrobiales bacterium]
LRKEMRGTAEAYEKSLRNTAPHRMMRAGYCDEQVGRYCVIYDVGTLPPLPPEPEEVRTARGRAIQAFQQAVKVWPNDSTLVAPLIRYLVEDERGADAVEVARRYADIGPDRVWSAFLLGFALHGAGDDALAEQTFLRALYEALPNERQEMHDVMFLLRKDEQPRYRALSGPERARYLERLWRLADPLYLTPGNESQVEHYARRVYARILSYAPGADGMGWGPDQEQLLIRFGAPTARTYNFGQGQGRQLTEHYHPDQMTYVPPAQVTRVALSRFEPGSPWPYDTVRAFSGYAPRSIRRMRVLEHQVARFPGDSLMRADFVVVPDDSAGRPARVEVGLFALDSTYEVIAEARDTILIESERVAGSISVRLPAGAAAYSLEALELGTRYAQRARYALPVVSGPRPVLSDVVIFAATDAAPPANRESAAFQPLPSLVIPRGTAIGIYIEARGLARTTDGSNRYRVDLEVLEQDKPGIFSRAVRRLGRALGMQSDDVAPRITWTQQQAAATTASVGLKLGSVGLDPGLKQFKITVTDLQTNRSASVDRLVKVVD